MTMISITSPEGRISAEQRAELAKSLTDAVLDVEIGRHEPLARAGCQIHFNQLPSSQMAHNGQLVSETDTDLMLVDIAVAEGDWPKSERKRVIEGIYAALVQALNVEEPSKDWWVKMKTVEEGSAATGGNVLSMLDFLELGIFSETKSAAIRKALQN